MTADDRTAVALFERIATALERSATAQEQMALDAIPADALPTGEPPLPTPPPDMVILSSGAANASTTTAPLPPVVAPQYQFTGPSAFCPVHRVPWKTVPAGVSKKTGNAYSAFLACPERGCNEKPQAPR
jgi:hypothetical protein